jgi:hypothetical protein
MIVSASLMGTMQAVRSLLLTLLALLALVAGCGGGDDDDGSASPNAAPTPTDVQTVTVPNTASPQPKASGEPAFDATLSAQSHEAQPGAAWSWTVTAKKDGAPASATAKMRVFVDDELVDTLGWFPFEGSLTKVHRWPRALSGKTVVFQAEVEGEGGTRRVNWPVSIS